ncbi:MAG: UvrD-helicase domain-containing protein [Nitrospirae bacterium]|nr:UvrD-helicase domain-containing protein [Candidatus Manganitrophaceae bacterium]
MDAFEPVRVAALQLHAELLTKGADSNQLMELVHIAVRHLEIELAWLPAGDPALKGARALFDEQAGLICCVDEGDPGVRACLVAHELGHVCVHAGSGKCRIEDIDPSRSTEAAPVGLQRVEDYGVRERRELQANVFARELLLPRDVARHRYLAGENASAIAQALKLPKDIVRQQLLDALLLPPAPQEARRVPEKQARPDPSQDRASEHRGSAFQLQAGPGTGKTRTLVKRVLSLLRDGVDPNSILVLTFSNRAAGELSERLTAVVPNEAPKLWIGTFHAFGLDLIRRYHDKLDLPQDPPLFDRSDAIEVLEEVLPTLPLVHYRNLWDPAFELRDIVGAISRAKDEMAGADRYYVLAQAMLDRATDPDSQEQAAKALEVAHVYKIYQDTLRSHQAVDFGDLIMLPTLLLERDEAVRTSIRLRHRHVLVDEYQDVNRASSRLLRAISGDGRRLWVVGDARQSIYRFRGASSINMTRFTEEYPDAVVDRLTVNYRSSKEIIDAFEAVALHIGASEGMLSLELDTEAGFSGIHPQLRITDTLDDEAAGIAASIRELETRGVRLRDQAVLCRTNSRLNDIAMALELCGIPVLHLGSLFERDEVRDLLTLLTLAIDPFGDGLARVGAMPRYDLPLQDIQTAIRLLRELPGTAVGKIHEIANDSALSPEGKQGFSLLAADLAGIPAAASPWEFLATYLLDRTDLLARLVVLDGVSDRMRTVAIWQFLNFVRDRSPIGAGAPFQRTLDRVRQLVLLAEERDLRQIPAGALHMDAVRLMTVHGSKGLEFEAVHVPGLTVASFPSSNRRQGCPLPAGLIEGMENLDGSEAASRAQTMEEECLFFVALSRARNHLHLYCARKQSNGNNRNPSPFLDWFSESLVTRILQPPKLPLPPDASRPKPIPVTWGKNWKVTDSLLRSYEKCPRRFFYTHVLGLGSARKKTAFGQTHDCLYELIRWLAGARSEGSGSHAEASLEFERLWRAKGPVDHAFAVDYRRLANRLVDALVRSGAGHHFRRAEPLAIDFAGGRVIVQPDETRELPDGTVVLRRVRTGYRRKEEYDELEYTLYHLAGRARYGASYSVEALHLTDEIFEPVSVTPQKIKNRRDRSEAMVASIAGGHFLPKPDAITCPRCPHFFVCAAVGGGPISLT